MKFNQLVLLLIGLIAVCSGCGDHPKGAADLGAPVSQRLQESDPTWTKLTDSAVTYLGVADALNALSNSECILADTGHYVPWTYILAREIEPALPANERKIFDTTIHTQHQSSLDNAKKATDQLVSELKRSNQLSEGCAKAYERLDNLSDSAKKAWELEKDKLRTAREDGVRKNDQSKTSQSTISDDKENLKDSDLVWTFFTMQKGNAPENWTNVRNISTLKGTARPESLNPAGSERFPAYYACYNAVLKSMFDGDAGLPSEICIYLVINKRAGDIKILHRGRDSQSGQDYTGELRAEMDSDDFKAGY